jgi:Tripartite tricarboxylate transporter family receptor
LPYEKTYFRSPGGHVDLAAMRDCGRISDPSHQINCAISVGGPTDTLGRIIAERMSRTLGQSILVENIAGAGGSIGVERVVRARPDGYTVSLGNWSTHVLNGAIYSLGYDLVNDLEPVALLPSAPQIIVARKDIKANNLADLIAWIKANRTTLGTAGVGSAGHVSALLFEKQTDAPLTIVHYRGGAPAMNDLIGGHIDMMIDPRRLHCRKFARGRSKRSRSRARRGLRLTLRSRPRTKPICQIFRSRSGTGYGCLKVHLPQRSTF